MSRAAFVGLLIGSALAVGIAIVLPPDDVLRGVMFGAFCAVMGACCGARIHDKKGNGA